MRPRSCSTCCRLQRARLAGSLFLWNLLHPREQSRPVGSSSSQTCPPPSPSLLSHPGGAAVSDLLPSPQVRATATRAPGERAPAAGCASHSAAVPPRRPLTARVPPPAAGRTGSPGPVSRDGGRDLLGSTDTSCVALSAAGRSLRNLVLFLFLLWPLLPTDRQALRHGLCARLPCAPSSWSARAESTPSARAFLNGRLFGAPRLDVRRPRPPACLPPPRPAPRLSLRISDGNLCTRDASP